MTTKYIYTSLRFPLRWHWWGGARHLLESARSYYHVFTPPSQAYSPEGGWRESWELSKSWESSRGTCSFKEMGGSHNSDTTTKSLWNIWREFKTRILGLFLENWRSVVSTVWEDLVGAGSRRISETWASSQLILRRTRCGERLSWMWVEISRWTVCYSTTLNCRRACPLCYVVQVRFEGETKTVGNQAVMRRKSVGGKRGAPFRDRGTRRQACIGSCFQNGELSGDGLKRCCGGRERDRGSVLYDEWFATVLYKVCLGVCRLWYIVQGSLSWRRSHEGGL